MNSYLQDMNADANTDQQTEIDELKMLEEPSFHLACPANAYLCHDCNDNAVRTNSPELGDIGFHVVRPALQRPAPIDTH